MERRWQGWTGRGGGSGGGEQGYGRMVKGGRLGKGGCQDGWLDGWMDGWKRDSSRMTEDRQSLGNGEIGV